MRDLYGLAFERGSVTHTPEQAKLINKMVLVQLFLLGLVIWISGCAQAVGPGLDYTEPAFKPGVYVFTLENTGTANEFCEAWGIGQIDLTSLAAYQGINNCPDNATCTTDAFSLDDRSASSKLHIEVNGFTDFKCTYTFDDAYTLNGTCADDWGLFVCHYESSLVLNPSE